MVAHYVLAPSTAELRVVGDEHSVAVMGVDRELVVGLVVEASVTGRPAVVTCPA
jgi:hypothetical protein